MSGKNNKRFEWFFKLGLYVLLSNCIQTIDASGESLVCIQCSPCEMGTVIKTCQPGEVCYSYSELSKCTTDKDLSFDTLAISTLQVNLRMSQPKIAHQTRMSATSSLRFFHATPVIGACAIPKSKDHSVAALDRTRSLEDVYWIGKFIYQESFHFFPLSCA